MKMWNIRSLGSTCGKEEAIAKEEKNVEIKNIPISQIHEYKDNGRDNDKDC